MQRNRGAVETLKEILARCQRGEEDAVEILLRRFQPRALQFASSVLDDRAFAPDVVQESFIAALDKLPTRRYPEAFPGWFRQIIRTRASRANRQRSERQVGDPESIASSRPDSRQLLHQREVARMVRRAVDSLPPRSRATAELFYFRELKHAEIARRLDVPVGTVKRRLHDARRTLRVLLTRLADECRPDESADTSNAPFTPHQSGKERQT